MIKLELTLPADLPMSRARAAGITAAATRFTAGVMFVHGSCTINAKSTLGVLTLVPGTTLTLLADGPDETAAVQAVQAAVLAE